MKVRVTEKIREFLRASLDEKEIKTKLEEKILQELEQSLETYSEGEITEGQERGRRTILGSFIKLTIIYYKTNKTLFIVIL